MKSKNMLKAEAIAQVVAACVNAQGGTGPFGGEVVEPDGNQLTLSSQVTSNAYEFHADGTVDLLDPETVYDDIMESCELTKKEMIEDYGTKAQFVKDYTNMSFETFMSPECGWFYGSPLETACIAFVKALVESH